VIHGVARTISSRYHLGVLLRDPRDFIRRAALFARRRWYRLLGRKVRRALGGVTFTFDFTLPHHIDLMYLGIYEPELIAVLRQHLTPGGVCVDVGASIGYVSATAADLVGPAGQVHAFEPVPRYFENLARLRDDNPAYTIVANRCAVGAEPGRRDIDVTSLPNIGWNTMVPGFMDAASRREVVPIEVVRLDDYLLARDVRRVDLIKIDTEGFEYYVLRGLERFVRDVYPELPPLYVEVAPQAYPLLGITLDDLRSLVMEYGYRARAVENDLAVELTGLTRTTNVMLTARRALPVAQKPI
jgi:FkbM family methyltransferase